MQQDRKRCGVGSEDDNLSGATVERLGGLVGTLLELAVVAGRLDDVQDFLRVPWSALVAGCRGIHDLWLIPGSGQRRRRARRQTRSGWTC